MYVGKILGETIRLWNTDYKSLKKKWHPDNVEVLDGDVTVMGECSLCRKFFDPTPCPDCPLSVFREDFSDHVGCWWLLKRLFPRTEFEVCRDWTSFETGQAVVKRYMQKIQDILDTFKKENGGDESSG